MPLKDVCFSALNLYLNGESPSVCELNEIFKTQDETEYSPQGNTTYLVSSKQISGKFYWMYFRYGNTLPHPQTVYDINSHESVSNPREIHQVEIDNQFFCLYDQDSKILYISNLKKQDFLKIYISTCIARDVSIKYIIKSPDDVLSIFNTVSEIEFVARQDLFSNAKGVFDILPDPDAQFGLGRPARFTITANFNDASLTELAKQKIMKLINWKRECAAEDLVCRGKDDKGFSHVYNVESFTKKVSLRVNIDEQGFVNQDEVCNLLVSHIS